MSARQKKIRTKRSKLRGLKELLAVGKETLAGHGLTREELEQKWTTLIEVSQAVLSLVPDSLGDESRRAQLFDIVGRPPTEEKPDGDRFQILLHLNAPFLFLSR